MQAGNQDNQLEIHTLSVQPQIRRWIWERVVEHAAVSSPPFFANAPERYPTEVITLTPHTDSPAARISCSGYCARCGTEHNIVDGPARGAALELMGMLETTHRIDFPAASPEADPRFSTDYLFGVARGQMFGVLVCRRQDGSELVLRAFSGQYDGVWQVPGWVGPLFDVPNMDRISGPVEKAIKAMGAEISGLEAGMPARVELVSQRRALSRQLMHDMHGIYRLTNFCGESRPLAEVFTGGNGIPAGTGDCCAPKLLHHAARNNLTPLGLAEFYWGKENLSSTRRHGCFYPPCEGKCRPILGFMLCGLEGRM